MSWKHDCWKFEDKHHCDDDWKFKKKHHCDDDWKFKKDKCCRCKCFVICCHCNRKHW